MFSLKGGKMEQRDEKVADYYYLDGRAETSSTVYDKTIQISFENNEMKLVSSRKVCCLGLGIL